MRSNHLRPPRGRLHRTLHRRGNPLLILHLRRRLPQNPPSRPLASDRHRPSDQRRRSLTHRRSRKRPPATRQPRPPRPT
ncbi:hypothetical protein NS365_21665, partial [Aureimonas ureilytica]